MRLIRDTTLLKNCVNRSLNHFIDRPEREIRWKVPHRGFLLEGNGIRIARGQPSAVVSAL